MIASHPWNGHSSEIGLVALTGSAGSLEAFCAILQRLPREFPAPVLVCQHRWNRPPGEDSLVRIFRHCCRLEVVPAKTGTSLRARTVYVAPPSQHLFCKKDKIVLCEPDGVNQSRPSADLLLDSLAAHFGRKLIAVVLSGVLSDGAVGVVKVKASGGRVIVQEPSSAWCQGMPNAAIASGCADFVLPVRRIGDAITTLTMVPGADALFPSFKPAWAV